MWAYAKLNEQQNRSTTAGANTHLSTQASTQQILKTMFI